MLTLGTGVGGGVVIDGEPFRGATGLGAELGHMVLEVDGPDCPGSCPNRGCLEALCSGLALEHDATRLGREHPDSTLGAIVAREGRATGRDAVAAAREGDSAAQELLHALGRRLGAAIAGAINVFQPEEVVIGGGIAAAAGDLFFEHACREARARALPAVVEGVAISLARRGAAAGAVGAGTLAAQELLPRRDTGGAVAVPSSP
jgi:glucokinase